MFIEIDYIKSATQCKWRAVKLIDDKCRPMLESEDDFFLS